MDYKSSGVDIAKGDQVVVNIKKLMGKAGSRIGHFGGAISIPSGYTRPLLVSSIDSVGTKVKVASALRRYGTIGYDMLHHSINDIAVCGAEPMGFLDYYACSSLDVEVATEVVGGVIKACEAAEVALLGGEICEMPGVYAKGEFDLVGAIWGIVEEDDYIDGRSVVVGDILIGFPSNGLHTNGYSLARKILEINGLTYHDRPSVGNDTFGEALLKIHINYLPVIRALKRIASPKGLAHITGGGLPGNVSRIISKGLRADINYGVWAEPPIFTELRKLGKVPEEDMRRTFNLGIGLVAAVTETQGEVILKAEELKRFNPIKIGKVCKC